MTERIYYEDAYLTRFRARVVEQLPLEGRFALLLDRTAFYPTSGGQPFDRGVINGRPVRDVLVREGDNAVLHVLEESLPDDVAEVWGEIDWERRFDHMQQHTGQHILSQAFIKTLEAETVSFHLGVESATIDLFGPSELSTGDMEKAELLANQIVWEDRPVSARVVAAGDLTSLPLRKLPVVTNDIRIIEVQGFDWSPCGGTHVARTGEIGLIKVIKSERRGAELRVEFRCGMRALQDCAQKNTMLHQVAASFNVGHWELDQAVERLRAENKDLRAQLRQAGRLLAQYRTDELRAAAPAIAGVRLVLHNLNAEPLLDMRELARELVSEPDVIALLGAGEDKALLCFARSANLGLDMVSLVRDTVQMLGARAGGGRPDFAQGGSVLEEPHQLEDALHWAARHAREQLERTG
jgi:alanyl-tRNA synthetase